MSYSEAMAKLRWYQLRAMESPLGSTERQVWIGIKRELEVLVQRATAPGATGTVVELMR